jgi:hypothetical protein
MFIEIGRNACEEHYRAARRTITRWLEECGKPRLIEARAEYVKARSSTYRRPCPQDFPIAFVRLGIMGCVRRYNTDSRRVHRWLDECGRERLVKARLAQVRPPSAGNFDLVDVGRIISRAYPVRT